MAHAPHLPTQKPDKQPPNRFLLTVVFVSIFFGLLAGTTAALVVSTWITPSVNSVSEPFIFKQVEQNKKISVDAQVERHVSEKVISLYKKSDVVYQTYDQETSFIADAVVVSSDGWAVLSLKDFKAGQQNNWFGVDRRGVNYTIRIAYADRTTDLVYVQFKGDDFRVASFADWTDMSVNQQVIFADKYALSIKKISDIKTVQTTEINKDQIKFLIDDVDSGLLFTQDGRFIGFAQQGVLSLAYKVQHDLPTVLRGAVLKNDKLSFKGKHITHIISDDKTKEQQGFLLTNVNYPYSKMLKRGDVVIRINGQDYDQLITSRQLLFSDQDITLDIIRDGKEMSVGVKKTA